MGDKIPCEYRPIPFWSWNERLNVETTVQQIEQMYQQGIGGFFMHARGGLQTPYMEDDWFRNIEAGIDAAKQRGMKAWAYDESGWPSGFGDGFINGQGMEYQQKYLRMERGERQTPFTIGNAAHRHFYFEVNPFYVDLMNPHVTDLFLEKIYRPYCERYGQQLEGFFTDEPQLSRNGIPWSTLIPSEYEKAYDESLIPKLGELFFCEGDYSTTRFRFYKLVTEMFVENFTKRVYEFCQKYGLQLTGHMVLEETMEAQLSTNGAVMPHYEYFHIPGIDWLGKKTNHKLTPLQVSSVAHQLGKKKILTESLALTGWDADFEEFKRIVQWQMVRGVTLLCPHLQSYSLRGIRKRDYPPSIFYQQPYWKYYHLFVNAISTTGQMLSEGAVQFDVLLIHPQSTAWTLFDGKKNKGMKAHEAALCRQIDLLEQKHICFHLGDETIMARHGCVQNGRLVIGEQRYKTVIMPQHQVLFDTTVKLMEAFQAQGGVVTTCEDILYNDIIDNSAIVYTKRHLKKGVMHYFVNESKQPQSGTIAQGNCVIDALSGCATALHNPYTFQPYESLIVLESEVTPNPCKAMPVHTLPLGGDWQIVKCDKNALVLDRCDYYFDEVLQEEKGFVCNIQKRACDRMCPVSIRMEFQFSVKHISETLSLCIETPELFEIVVNDHKINSKPYGTYVDSSFKLLDISSFVVPGLNRVVLTMCFAQTEKVLKNLCDATMFEAVKNKLTYDMEVESIYLIGDFELGAAYEVQQPKDTLKLAHIEKQGYPFFAGSMTLRRKIVLNSTDYRFAFKHKHACVVEIQVNGKRKQILWKPYEVDISDMLQIGENDVSITLIGTLRNLLGPHHMGEPIGLGVSPDCFFQEQNIWGCAKWSNEYHLVPFGIQ